MLTKKTTLHATRVLTAAWILGASALACGGPASEVLDAPAPERATELPGAQTPSASVPAVPGGGGSPQPGATPATSGPSSAGGTGTGGTGPAAPSACTLRFVGLPPASVGRNVGFSVVVEAAAGCQAGTTVTLAASSASGARATATGTLVAPLVGSRATFADVRFADIGSDYVLTANAQGAPASSTPAFVVTTPGSLAKDQLFLWQGALGDLGSPEEAARTLARYDTISISQIHAFKPSEWVQGDCQVGEYAHMKDLVRRIRLMHTSIEIFGYVASTADAPAGTQCGYGTASNKWSCKNGVCSDFVNWTEKWFALDGPGTNIDGVMIDLMSNVYMSSVVRDNIVSYVKGRGKRVMMNTPIGAENVTFGGNAAGLAANDYLFIEGFMYGLGSYLGQTSIAAQAAYEAVRARVPVRLAVLASEGYGAGISCTAPNVYTAYRQFLGSWRQGAAVFAYQSGDLGLINKVAPFCDHNAWVP